MKINMNNKITTNDTQSYASKYGREGIKYTEKIEYKNGYKNGYKTVHLIPILDKEERKRLENNMVRGICEIISQYNRPCK